MTQDATKAALASLIDRADVWTCERVPERARGAFLTSTRLHAHTSTRRSLG